MQPNCLAETRIVLLIPRYLLALPVPFAIRDIFALERLHSLSYTLKCRCRELGYPAFAQGRLPTLLVLAG
jgi:hypothetical protein